MHIEPFSDVIMPVCHGNYSFSAYFHCYNAKNSGYDEYIPGIQTKTDIGYLKTA